MHPLSAMRGLLVPMLCLSLLACGGGTAPGPSLPTPPAPVALPSSLSITGPTEIVLGARTRWSSSLGASTEGLTVEWRSGDGASSSLPEPDFVYERPAVYTVSMTVRNSAGQSITARKLLQVQAPASARASVCSGPGTQGWCWRAPNPTGTPPLNDWFFIDSQHGWAAGDGGTLLRTDDGGRQWAAQESGTEADLSLVRFADEREGWAYSRDGRVLHTADGGTRWSSAGNLLIEPEAAFLLPLGERSLLVRDRWRDVSFVTYDAGRNWSRPAVYPWLATRPAGGKLSLHGVLATQPTLGWGRSVDGGRTVVQQTSAAAGKQLLSIGDAGSGVLWATAGQRTVDAFGQIIGNRAQELVRSTDDGVTWGASVALPDTLNADSVVMRHNGIGLARPMPLWLRDRKPVLRTTDGGVTWTSWDQPAGLAADQFDDIRYNAERVVVTRRDGVRLVSGDMGVSFDVLPALPPGASFKVAKSESTQDNQGALLSNRVLSWPDGSNHLTLDDGQHWSRLPDGKGAVAGFNDLWFADDNAGTAIADRQLWDTRDGGRSWEKRAEMLPAVRSLLRGRDGILWAVANDGLYRSDNQGRDWSRVNDSPNLIPPSPGFGPMLTELVSMDGRTGWSLFTTVSFLCPSSAPQGACGPSTQLFVTLDGGRHWTEHRPSGAGDLRRFRMISAEVWLRVYADGSVGRSDNGGASYTTLGDVGLPAGAAAQDIWFLDAQRGWVHAADRTWRTVDGGRTWSAGATFVPGSWTAMRFSDARHGWLGGRGGRLLATSDGGQTWVEQPTGLRRDIEVIFALDADRVWISGSGGALLATTTGGR